MGDWYLLKKSYVKLVKVDGEKRGGMSAKRNRQSYTSRSKESPLRPHTRPVVVVVSSKAK